nr:putative per-hexamer repeat protein 5 [Anser cygnoides]
MFPEERKEGSPRFGKLHFPVGLWINSPKKHLAKMSRRWPSAGSVRSTSSDNASRGSETVELRPPGKSKPARHKRLSNLFHRSGGAGAAPPGAGGRWASEKKLAELADPLPEELAELGGRPQLPGILKIFGGAISRGANYKSVLATPRSTARQLVREALERYGLSPEEGDFVLCDVVGRAAGPDGSWQAEHLRPVGDAERPLVLQDVWKPKAGCSRRFEIRRRRDVERACEAEDTETAVPADGGGPAAKRSPREDAGGAGTAAPGAGWDLPREGLSTGTGGAEPTTSPKCVGTAATERGHGAQQEGADGGERGPDAGSAPELSAAGTPAPPGSTRAPGDPHGGLCPAPGGTAGTSTSTGTSTSSSTGTSTGIDPSTSTEPSTGTGSSPSASTSTGTDTSTSASTGTSTSTDARTSTSIDPSTSTDPSTGTGTGPSTSTSTGTDTSTSASTGTSTSTDARTSTSTSNDPSTTTGTSTSIDPSTSTNASTSTDPSAGTSTDTDPSTGTDTSTETSTSASTSTTTGTSTSTSTDPSTTTGTDASTSTGTSTSNDPSTTTGTTTGTSNGTGTSTGMSTSTDTSTDTSTTTTTSTSTDPSTTGTSTDTSIDPSTTTSTNTSTSTTSTDTSMNTTTSTSTYPSIDTSTTSTTTSTGTDPSIDTSTTSTTSTTTSTSTYPSIDTSTTSTTTSTSTGSPQPPETPGRHCTEADGGTATGAERPSGAVEPSGSPAEVWGRCPPPGVPQGGQEEAKELRDPGPRGAAVLGGGTAEAEPRPPGAVRDTPNADGAVPPQTPPTGPRDAAGCGHPPALSSTAPRAQPG